jgi:hypothetical protein
MFSRLITWGACAALVLGLVSGCGGKGKLRKVTGVVTWEDGTPVDGATIVFAPKDSNIRQASGFTGKDGAFDLTTFSPGDGAMDGDYKIVVTKSDVTAETGSAGPSDHPDVTKMMQEDWQKKQGGAARKQERSIPAVYTKESTTPLVATINSSTGKIELKLKKV